MLFQLILQQDATLFALDESNGEHPALAMPIPHGFSGIVAVLLFQARPGATPAILFQRG